MATAAGSLPGPEVGTGVAFQPLGKSERRRLTGPAAPEGPPGLESGPLTRPAVHPAANATTAAIVITRRGAGPTVISPTRPRTARAAGGSGTPTHRPGGCRTHPRSSRPCPSTTAARG